MKRLYDHKTGKQLKLGGSIAIPFVSLPNGKKLYTLTTAVTSGVTTDSVGAVLGDLAVTTHATGHSQLFFSDGTNWVGVSDSDAGQANFVAALTSNSGGTANGAMESIGTLALSTTNTYTDAAVNTAVNTILAKVANDIAELQTTQEAIRANLIAGGLMKSS